jgi:hypothetical protein
MTESEWLTCTQPRRMLLFLRREQRTSDRKMRLFICACYRRIWHLLGERRRREIEAHERHADALPPDSDHWPGAWAAEIAERVAGWAVEQAAQAAEVQLIGREPPLSRAVNEPPSWRNQAVVCEQAVSIRRQTRADEQRAQSDLIREIVGNPFRSVRLRPYWLQWNDACILHLARAIHDGEEYCSLPILADALMDAGCDDAEMVEHCRSAQHVRGCWVIDLLLGKS